MLLKDLFGVENTFQSADCKEKSKQKNLKLYGVEYPSQNKEIQEKILFKKIWL